MTALISSVLSPIIKLWLRSQVDAVENLQVKIGGSNRQILQGQVPQAEVAGQCIIYQGLHMSNISLIAEGIHLNIPQILHGEALKLVEPITVLMDVTLEAQDLQRSLKAAIVNEAVGDRLPEVNSDTDVRSVLEMLLDKLGKQFVLQKLTVMDGGCQCQGIFTVAATDVS